MYQLNTLLQKLARWTKALHTLRHPELLPVS
jgi:hypothetical protein